MALDMIQNRFWYWLFWAQLRQNELAIWVRYDNFKGYIHDTYWHTFYSFGCGHGFYRISVSPVVALEKAYLPFVSLTFKFW